EAWQGEVVEEDLHELFLGEVEDEIVLTLPGIARLARAAAAAASALRPFDLVAAKVLLVARMHDLARAALAMAEGGLVDVALRDVDVLALLDVADAAAVDGTAHRFAHLLLVAAQEALAVADRLVLARKPPVDDLLQHGARPVVGGLRSAALAHAQVPLAEEPDLLGGVALLDHAVDEVLVLLGLVGARLGVEADHREQLLGVREHLLLDHRAQLLVARPGRVLAVVVGASAQHEVDDLVAEVLRVRDAGGLLDLLELGVQLGAVEHLAGVGVAVFLVLDPVVGVGDVAVEDVLAVLAVALEVGGLDLLADELGVARREVLLDEAEVLLLELGRELLALDLLLEHVHQVHRVGGDLGRVEVEDLRQDLEREAG